MTDRLFDHPEAAEAFPLIIQLFEECIDQAGIKRLDLLICQHPRVRRLYIQTAHQYCAVMPLIAGMQAETEQLGEIETDIEPVSTETEVESKQPAVRPIQWIKLGVISAAAMVICTFGLIWLLMRSPSNAVLYAQAAASWNAEIKPGQLLPDRAITLTSGLAKLQMKNGAMVIIEAPATFRVTKPDEIELNIGSLTATASGPAHGFTVHTPSAQVVDLGTEFGVKVDADHTTTVAVFQGKVETTTLHARSTADLPKSTLTAGQAIEVAPAGNAVKPVTAPVFARDNEFDQRTTELTVPVKNRWRTVSFQIRRDPDLVAYYLFDQEYRNVMTNSAATGSALDGTLGSDGTAPPSFATGRWAGKNALSFRSDALQYMKIPASPVLDFATAAAPARAFSIVIWVNADADQGNDVSILTHGKGLKEQYSVGIMRQHFRAWVRSSDVTPAKDSGNVEGPLVTAGWHQLVLTVEPAAEQIAFYVDGAQSAKNTIPPTLLPAGDSETMLGARVSHLDKIIPSFNGLVDEVAVYSRALPADKVSSLYDLEKP